MRKKALAIASAAGLLFGALAWAQDLAWFEANLTEHRLDNGLTFLIYERPGAPVVSFYTYVNVGSAQEVPGITGLAHMFEHMAFKGTTKIGTSDYQAEARAMAKVDEAYHAYDRERRNPFGSDPERVAEFKAAWEAAQDEAREYVVANEFGEIIDRAGGVGLNASTGADQTNYRYSLPANKVELWAYLESERFLDPVLREFYKERDVVMEERRMRIESQPIGRMIEQFVSAAFIAHPYHSLGIGYMSDLQTFTREDAQEFYDTYYSPANMTISIVGAVEAKNIIPILDKYFGRLPAGEPTPPLRTVEPEQIAERIVRMPDPAQPFYIEGYHRPAVTDDENDAYDALADVLSTGRTSRLYRSLVRDKKIAAQAAAFNGFPGQKYPNQMIFFAVPTPGHTNEEVQDAIREEIERIKAELISDEELAKIKTRAKANLIQGLQSNMGIARQLGFYQGIFGDWRELFRRVDRIEALAKEDIQRVAQQTLKTTSRTVGLIYTETETESDEGTN
jgi:predicted Zn-dependent peptidase